MTAGMNVAIFAMLGVTQFVLGGFIWFFLNIRKKSRTAENNLNNSTEG
jgi:hypothetical protein